MALPEVTEEPHFEKTSFRIKKKIFATYNDPFTRACIKLSEKDQDVFSAISKGSIYPVPNKWGKQGWTLIDMKKTSRKLFKDAVLCAYGEVAPVKLAEKIKTSMEKER